MAEDHQLTSPDGKLTVTISTDQCLRWSVDYEKTKVILSSEIGLKATLSKKDIAFGNNVRVSSVTRKTVDTSFPTPFYRKASVKDHYNQLTLACKEGFSVEFRAYDQAAAYRIVSTMAKPMTITDEKAQFVFADNYDAFIPYVNDNRSGERYCYSFESLYDEVPLTSMYPDSLSITPLAVSLPNGRKAVVLDAGVENYPGMFLEKGEGFSLNAVFAPYPTAWEVGGFDRLNLVPTERAPYIAKIDARQALPWRVVAVSRYDSDLLNNDIAQQLAPPCRISDTSWIKPGKVAWDWWNNLNVTGVDFKSGMNTDTYKYYIDFAAKNRLEYIIIDEGWSGQESLTEDISPDIDLSELLQYGKERGVGIVLWSSWRNAIKNMERNFAHYASMGVKGFKVDFFDRDDQLVIRSCYEMAACASRHHLLLDFHGLKPFGIQRAYPNIVNFEGVKGLENNKWEPRDGDGPVHNFPRYDVTAPYLRMFCGPMDYTPGAMNNATRDNYFGNNNHPMSQGTRVHQMAMYTLYEAPLQMLADSPTAYMQNQECTDFIARIPTTFDETVVLGGKIGEFVSIARRKGNTWYLSAMTNWRARDLTIDLSKLSAKGISTIEMFCDGVNADKDAKDYKRIVSPVGPTDTLDIHLAPGGGWAAIIK